MTKEQVWKAYEEMDRLDAELNGLANDSSGDSSSKSCSVNGPKQSKPMLNSTQIEFNSQSVNEFCAKTVATFSRNGSQGLSTHQNSHCQSLPAISQSFAVPTMDISDSSGEDSVAKEPSVTITAIAQQNDSNSNASSTTLAISQSRPISLYGEEPQELIEFKKKGELTMLNEIRAFVTKYNIRQIMIAEMTKISQGYVSRFFRGEGHDMSDKSKNLIYLWYLSCRQRPEILTQFCPQTIGERRTQLSEAGDLLPIRRDRFIFRKEHLMVLDKYFKDNPYPDSATKEMIADECNQYVEQTTGRALKERDKVSISVVSNWFNNKRKEVKTRRGPCGQSQLLGSDFIDHMTGDHSMQSHFFSNHSNCSVEELETRPDLSILSDFGRQESVDLSEETDIDPTDSDYMKSDKHKDSHHMSIKLEPTYWDQ